MGLMKLSTNCEAFSVEPTVPDTVGLPGGLGVFL